MDSQSESSGVRVMQQRPTVPIFLLVRQVKLRKRLDLARDAKAAQERIPGAIVAKWVEGRFQK
jgi:hypothetical protein